MTIKERLTSELKLAMKMKDKIGTEVKSKIMDAEKINVVEFNDAEVGKILVKAAKDHQKSIDAFKRANRTDLVEKEQSQLTYLKNYLPEEMDEQQIIFEVEKIILDNSYTSMKDMGKIMREFNDNFSANGEIVSKIAKERLNESYVGGLSKFWTNLMRNLPQPQKYIVKNVLSDVNQVSINYN